MLTINRRTQEDIVIGAHSLTLAELRDIAVDGRPVRLTDDPDQLQKLERAAALVDKAVNEAWPVYGVTTGFGGMANVPVHRDQAALSQNNLLSFLATGCGEPVDQRHVRAAMVLRANVLMRGCSGVRLELVDRLIRFCNAGATPIVRELGSIGASGDLVPLSTIARAISGNSNFVRVQFRGRELDGVTTLRELDLEPIDLLPKEGLALVNGTSFSSAIAANCISEARVLMALAMATQSMMLRALEVQIEPFADFVHRCKPHPGQMWVAQMMLQLLTQGRRQNGARIRRNGRKNDVQDRYSLRCLPQYLGPIAEGISRIIKVVETEMNAVSDNPLVDTDEGRFYQSGNFLGQYIGIAMDDLRRFLGLIAKHLDVQIASLVAPEFNRGLPSSLRGNVERSYNMGLKGLQITGNSIMPMLTYLGNPIVEHYPTHAEQFNQNVNGLSWGSANMAWRSIELFQHYLGVGLIFAVQSLDLRAKESLGHFDGRALLGPLVVPIYEATCQAMQHSPGEARPILFDDSDQWLEERLVALFDDLCSHGPIVQGANPILQSFDDSGL